MTPSYKRRHDRTNAIFSLSYPLSAIFWKGLSIVHHGNASKHSSGGSTCFSTYPISLRGNYYKTRPHKLQDKGKIRYRIRLYKPARWLKKKVPLVYLWCYHLRFLWRYFLRFISRHGMKCRPIWRWWAWWFEHGSNTIAFYPPFPPPSFFPLFWFNVGSNLKTTNFQRTHTHLKTNLKTNLKTTNLWRKPLPTLTRCLITPGRGNGVRSSSCKHPKRPTLST